MSDATRPNQMSIEDMLTQLDPPRRKLVQDEMGGQLTWKPPEIIKTIGPHDPDLFKWFQERQVDIVAKCIKKLAVIPDEAIAAMVSGETAEAKALRRTQFKEDQDALFELFRREPPWYAAGFGHPDHIADFEYWAKMTMFSLPEITCLSIGIPPNDFTNEKILALEKAKAEGLWPSLRFFLERQEQLARQFGHRYQGEIINPSRFIAWAEKVEFEVHPEFWRLLKKYHGGAGSKVDPGGDQPNLGPDKREIDTIALLFTLMAIEELGYRPEATRSPIPKEIADNAAKQGVTVSDDTVRKYLRMGARLIKERSKSA